ncbi:MAG: DUF1549 domain-containing protein, partial [Bacteroidota bacterium]
MPFPLKTVTKFIGITWMPLLLAVAIVGCKDKTSEYTEIDDELAMQQLPDSVDYSFHIKPILSDRCFACHGPDKNAIEAGLSLNSAEDAYAPLGENKDRYGIVPFDVKNSEIIKRIFTEDNGILMPPPESNLVLSDYEKALLKKWVAQGAKYKTHWAFMPPQPQTVPKLPEEDWVQNDIDKFVLKKMEEKGFEPSQKATKPQLLRRTFFSLTGLPPSVEQVEQFTKDTSENAFEKVVDSLL